MKDWNITAISDAGTTHSKSILSPQVSGKYVTSSIFMMAFPFLLTCASRDKREMIRNPHSVTKQTSDSPTVNNQGGLHLFSLTGGGASVIPVVIVGGIVMWLVWKGYRAFQRYETRKEARGPKKFRDLLRQQGEPLSSSDDNDGSDGDGSRQDPQKTKKRVRFHDDDLHSDAWLTKQEKQDREAFIDHLKLLRRQRHLQVREDKRIEMERMRSGLQHLHISDSHNVTTTQVHVHRPVQTELHQHLHLPIPQVSTTDGLSTQPTVTMTRSTGTTFRRFPAQETQHQTANELTTSRTPSCLLYTSPSPRDS